MAVNLFTGRAVALDRVIPTSGVTQGPAAAGPYPGVYCSVFLSGTTLLASVLDAGQNPLLNPFLVNTDGSFTFFGAAATYDLIFSTTVPVVRSPYLVQVPPYAFAGLPPSSALTEGNLAHVVDDDSLWIDTGTAWKQVGAAGSGTVTHTTAPNLAKNRIIIGNGLNDVTRLNSFGTTSTVLHGDAAAGPPTFGPVDLTTDITGILPAGNLGPVTEAQITNLVADLALKSPLDSPAFTSAPTAPTAGPGDASTKLATTAFARTVAIAAFTALNSLQPLAVAHGTSVAAGATDVTTCPIPGGLNADDRLLVFYEIESATQLTTIPFLRSQTDGINLVGLQAQNNIAAGNQTSGFAILQQRPSGPTALRAVSFSMDAAGSSVTPNLRSDVENVALTTPWTSPWTLTLHHGGVVAGGTFSYSWAVYRFTQSSIFV